MRAAERAQPDLDRAKARLEATERAFDELPTEAPAGAMLDFYNELSAAVRGRLDGAHTIARVNDALRDLFAMFSIEPPLQGVVELSVAEAGVVVMPLLRDENRLDESKELSRWITDVFPDSVLDTARKEGIAPRISPPLRKIHAPSPQLANAQEYRPLSIRLALPPLIVGSQAKVT